MKANVVAEIKSEVKPDRKMLSARIPQELFEEISKEAQSLNVSLSQFITALLRAYIKTNKE